METMIYRYIKKRDKTGHSQKIGIILAHQKDGKIRLGWSLVNRKVKDTFKKDSGILIALERSKSNTFDPQGFPPLVRKYWFDFVKRSTKYFQQATNRDKLSKNGGKEV